MADLFHNTPYEFSAELFASPVGGVYRVREREAPHATKIVKLVKRGSTKNDLDVLKRDYEISQHLQSQPHIENQIVRCEKFESFGVNTWIVKYDDEAESLKQFLSRCTTDEERLNLFWSVAPQLVKTIDDLHRAHVLHLDIKPDNILAIKDPNTGKIQIKLLDFSVSSIVSLQTPYINVKFDSMFGTPQFMSPEQSGRMSSRVDKRADIYSLGCTFYNLLSGAWVFSNCVTNKQWVNAHLKEIPEPISQKNPLVSRGIEKIIRKMMAKQPASRYISVRGIIKDLEEIQNGVSEEWRAGSHDVNDQFSLPTKMYGRDKEYQLLVDSLNAAEQQTRRELLLISGVSGSGKSRLVQELQFKYSTRAWFITSKYDQISSVPYQNLQSLCAQVVSTLLSEDEKRLLQIKAALLESLDGLGILLTNLVPQLESVIGKQNDLGELNAEELLNKMSQATLAFFKTISEEYSRMMVLFVDDLQWSAVNDLKILEKVLVDKSIRILMIGSYRSNEVGPDHHLSYFIDTLRKENTTMTSVELDLLDEESVHEYMSDLTLVPRLDEQLHALSSTVVQATQGNPFYLREIVNKMHLEGVWHFDYSKNCWQWNNEKLRNIQFASNVVDLMLSSIDAQLSQESQQLLQIAACIGNSFSVSLLRFVSDRPNLSKTDLMESTQAGWIVEVGDNEQFKWQHDKLQEAAYSMLSDERRNQLHLAIGTTLMDKYASDDTQLFKILGHLNMVIELVKQDPELTRKVKDLNIRGCRLAKSSNAFEQAINCAHFAIDLIGEDLWTTNYDEAYALHTQMALAYSSSKQPDKAVETLMRAEQNARDTAHRIEIAAITIQVYASSNQLKAGFDKVIDILKNNTELTFDMPPQDAAAQGAWIGGRMQEIMPLLMQTLPTLHQKETLTDRAAGAFVQLLGEVSPIVMVHTHLEPLLLPCICLLGGELVLRYGISEFTPIALANFAIAIGNITKDFGLCRQISRAGFEIGRSRYTQDKFLCHAYFSDLLHCASDKTLPEFVDVAESAIRYGLGAGEHSWATNSMLFATTGRLLTGWDVSETENSLAKYMKNATETQNMAPLCLYTGMKQVLEIMKGERDTFTEKEYPIPQLIHASFLRLIHAILGALANIYLHNYTAAYEHSSVAVEYRGDSETMLYEYAAPAVHVLVLSRLITHTEDKDTRSKYVNELKETLNLLKTYDANMDKMWKPVVALGEVELLKNASDSTTDRLEIIRAFEDVITKAHNYKFMTVAHLAGLELAAYEKSVGLDVRFVQIHMHDALRQADFYGAHGYCGLLRTIYSEDMASLGHLENSTTISSGDANAPTSSSTGNPGSGGRNIAQSQVIAPGMSSGSQQSFAFQKRVNLEVLFHSMLPLIVEETTATRVGVVLSEQFLTDAEENASATHYVLQYVYENGEIQKVGKPLPVNRIFSPVVNRVLRSRIPVVEEDMSDSELLSLDSSDYFEKNACMSLMVQPIIYSTVVAGALYLENSQTPGIFNKLRQNALKTLISVSLHSSQFYSTLNASYARFLPKQFLELLEKGDVRNICTGDSVTRHCCVSFLDIRNFTGITEQLTAKGSMKFVNQFLEYLCPEIENNDGFIDKFIGDAVMSLFPNSVASALKGVTGMIHALERLNADHYVNKDPLRIGIGLHYGKLQLGTVGYANRLDATCIGDTVNTASRLEGLTKGFGATIIVSQEYYDRLLEENGTVEIGTIKFNKLGDFILKGRTVPSSLYEVYDTTWKEDPSPREELPHILRLFQERRFEDCERLCAKIAKEYKENNFILKFYEETCAMYKEYIMDDDWNQAIPLTKDGTPKPLDFPLKSDFGDRRGSIVAADKKTSHLRIAEPQLVERSLTPTRSARIKWSEEEKRYCIVEDVEKEQ